MSTNPQHNTAPAVTFRVGSLGELRPVSEIESEEQLHDLLTLSGVEWYDAQGRWTAPFSFGAES